MGPSKAGGFPSKRTTLSCATALLLLTSLLPTSSRAADINISSRTYLLIFEREVTRAGSQNFAPLYEYLSADARGLGGTPISFHFYGWGRLDLQDDSGTGNRSGDLASAYLQYVHPTGNAEARLGRFFFAEGTAAEMTDGIFLKARTPLGLGMAVYGGVPVEHSIAGTKTGDSLYGGRLFFARPGFAEIGASYLKEKGDFQGDDRETVGGDLWVRPGGFVELVGRASYNISTSALASQRYVLRLTPVAAVDLALGYESYKYKDLFQNALNPVFLSPTVDNNDKVRVLFVILDWEMVKNVTLEAVLKNIKHDLTDPGKANRGELGVRHSYNDRKDVAGLSAALVSADKDENEYQEYRAFASYSPAKWRFALDALTQRFKAEFKDQPGEKNVHHVVASAGYKVLDFLQLAGDLTYTQSPRFKEDYAGLIRASLSFGSATGGKK
ncbi:MAG: hypothetical protein HZA60_02140 [Deltaproteobacteria bacterium]|nr:hypothetical protein [Deltaproteobacteria bacterium]